MLSGKTNKNNCQTIRARILLLPAESQCASDADCWEEEACQGALCVDPCASVCEGEYAACHVYDHKPYCVSTYPEHTDETGTLDTLCIVIYNRIEQHISTILNFEVFKKIQGHIRTRICSLI